MIGPDAPAQPFREPWEARAFALVVSLHRSGHFTWPEWVQAISAEIAAAGARGDPDLGNTYYHHWLAALEAIIARKALARPVEMTVRTIELATKPAAHPHPARREPLRIA